MTERAEQAFVELRQGAQVHSLSELVKRAGIPLVTVRCRNDQELIACVWRTQFGPLLVTGQRGDAKSGPVIPVAGTGVFRFDTPGQGFDDGMFASGHPWTPTVVLALELDFPPGMPCPRCDALIDADLGSEIVKALTGAPRRLVL